MPWHNPFALAFLAVALAATTVAAQTEAPPPIEAFGRLPRVSSMRLSPDGSRVAMALSQGDESLINVIDLADGRNVYGARMNEGDRLRSVDWVDDTRVTFLLSHTFSPHQVLPDNMTFRGDPRRVDYYRHGVADLTTRHVQMLSTNPDEPWADQWSELIAPIEGDPDSVRMIGRAQLVETMRRTVYRIDLRSGRERALSVDGVNADTSDYILDERGQVAVRIDADRRSNRWRVFTYDGERERLLLEDVSLTGAPISIAGLLPDGRLVAVDADASDNIEVLVAIDRQTGEREVLFAADGYDVGGAILDQWTRRVVGVGWTAQWYEQRFFDPQLEAARVAAQETFPGGVVSVVSWSRDRTRIILYGESGIDGGGYYLFTPADRSVRLLSHLYPEVADSLDGERIAFTYPARDGVRINAYLTMPHGAAGGPPPPLVVLVHGGPSSRDGFDFDWWAGFLASRGYAVFQPNFRGSSGYGRNWERAGWGQWGGLMQTDVEDGVAVLQRGRLVDAGRACIVGASYGGYAALAGATLTPDLYRCAASIAGVSDLNEMLAQVSAETRHDSISSDYWRLSIGDRREDAERIRSVSPANLAERVRSPVLLIHGTNDTVVPIDQSRRMLRALQRAGKDVRFVELEGDDHHLSDAETRIQMLRELEAFLAQHLGPAAQQQ